MYHVSGPVTVTLLRNWILQSGNMWLVGKATGSEQGHFQAERARLCQLGYSPHKKPVCLCSFLDAQQCQATSSSEGRVLSTCEWLQLHLFLCTPWLLNQALELLSVGRTWARRWRDGTSSGEGLHLSASDLSIFASR